MANPPQPRRATGGGIAIGAGRPLALIAGPWVIENDDLMMRTAETVVGLTRRIGIRLIFKSSFEKDNRSSAEFYRGPGIEMGLKLPRRIKDAFGVPVTSDVHRDGTPAEKTLPDQGAQLEPPMCRSHCTRGDGRDGSRG